MTTPNVSALICGLRVSDLHGIYSYNASISAGDDERAKRLLLLYGDNGCGKTTIVNLIHNLLSQPGNGHRTFLANTRFHEFTLLFENGKELQLLKHHKSGLGTYTIRLLDGGEQPASVDIPALLNETTEKYVVEEKLYDRAAHDEIFRKLSPVGFQSFLLTDERELKSDFISGTNRVPTYDQILIHLPDGNIQPRTIRSKSRQKDQITVAVDRAVEWLRTESLKVRRNTDASTSEIYAQAIRAITQSNSQENTSDEGARIDAQLESISRRFRELEGFGMAAEAPSTELIAEIRNSNQKHRGTVATLLKPYLASLTTRLDGYQPVTERVRTFVNILNEFYRNKSVSLDAIEGLEILSSHNDILAPTMLSSGEKQLMLLLCSIIVGTSDNSIFIVDEPELSLNIKWQRRLVDALLDLTAGTSVQFIMATHSFEILSRHDSSILELREGLGS